MSRPEAELSTRAERASSELLQRVLTPPLWPDCAVWRYALAVMLVVVATVLRWALIPWLGVVVPYNLAVVAVIVSAAWLGTGPSLLTMLLADIAVELFIVSPAGIRLDGATIGRFGTSIGIGIFLCLVLRALRTTRLKARQEAAAALDAKIALGFAEKRARNIIKHAPAAIYEMAFDGSRFLTVNEVACEIVGYTRDELLSMSAWDLLEAESAAVLRERIASKEAGLDVADAAEYRVKAKDGRLIDVLLHVGAFRYKDGKLDSMLLVAHDITARKRAETEVRESREKYQALIETTADFIWEMDAQGRYTYCSPQMERLWGLDPAEMVGKTPFDLMPAEHRASAAGAFAELTKAPRPFSGLETASLDGHGRLVHLEVSGVPFFDSRGKLLGYRGMSRDITERKKQERAVVLEEVFRSAPSFFHILRGPQFVFEYANEAYYRLVGQRELVGRPAFEALPEAARLGFEERLTQAMSTREPFIGRELPVMLTRSPGAPPEERLVDLYCAPLVSADGSCDRVLGLGTDVTEQVRERKRAEDRVAADLDALKRMHALSGKLLETGDIRPLLQEVMEAAVSITAAEKGTLQLLEGGALKIVAHCGHERPFLDFFAAADNVASVCGEATRRGDRVVVPDVESSPLFVGTPSLSILRTASVRAVQSTPLRTRAGRLLGILTTQWGAPHTPDEHSLWRLDLLTRQAADFIERAQAEEALRRSQAETQTLLENTPAGLVLFEAKRPYKVLAHNRYYQELFAEPFHSRGMVGLHVFEYAPAVEAEGVVAVFDEVVRTQRPKSFLDFPYKSDPPKQSWFNWHISPLILDGEIVALVSMSLDVTDRHLAEEALRESEERYRTLFESIDEGFCIVEMLFDDHGRPTDYRFLEMNPAFAAQTGLTDAKGRTVREMVPQHEEHWFEVYGKIALTGEPARFQREARHLDPPRWHDVYAFRYGPAEKRQVAVLFNDVAARKRAEEERERLQHELKADLDAMTRLQHLGALFVKENDLGPILSEIVEAAIAIAGADFGNMQVLDTATSSLRIVAQRGFPQWWLDYWTSVSHGQGSCGTALERAERVIVEDVERSPVFVGTPGLEVQLRAGVRAVQSTPLFSRSGRPLGMFSTHYRAPKRPDDRALRLLDLLARQASDIIERAQAEASLQAANAQLIEADRAKNEFLGVLSHELRNPLAPIGNSLYVLDRAAPGGAQAERAKQVIGRQVGQLSNLVNDLLDVTRITRKKVQLQKERLELNEVVHRAVEDNRSLFERAGVHLKLAPAPRPVPLIADPTRLTQVVGNLLQNAAKFTSKGGHTRVAVAVEGSEAVVRVTDDGVGMSRETLDRLFQPFSQAEQALDRSKGGLGLGLALVKGLVELHGGTVSARSEGLGRGAEMIVRLRLDTGAALEVAAAPTSVARARRRVLIIEDNADAAESLSEALALSDHEVMVAYNGQEGLAKAREFFPEVVLCDIGLPGMDGYDVARAFRADEALKGTFLVALSGYALPDDLQRAADAGFERHLAKPPSLEKLEQLLEALPGVPAGGASGAGASAPPSSSVMAESRSQQ